MARSRATVFTDIWSPDSEFRLLTANAQRTYFMLLSLADLTLCGVVALTVDQWSCFASDTDAEAVASGLDELDERRYVIVDDKAQQLWIRTFTKHDGVLKQPNVVVAMSKDFSAIQSKPIREAFIEGLPKDLLEGLPKGWFDKLGKPFVEAFLRVCARAPTSDLRLTTSDSTPGEGDASVTAGRERAEPYEAEFNEAWTHYPRKISRLAAFKAYKARRRSGETAADLLKATEVFATCMTGRVPDHVMHGSRFYGSNDEWRDYLDGDPEPVSANGRGTHDPEIF
jgi:hypothetical protein